ncbi:MAG: hypothetical protein WBA59_03930 [Moheibacter sp.]
MASSFETFKEEIINLQKRIEINQNFHQFIKASDWDEVIQVVRAIAFGSEYAILWSVENDIVDERILSMIPVVDLENRNVYNTSVSLTNPGSNIIIRKNGELELTMDSDNKVKLIMFGGTAEVTLDDASFLEVELYNESEINIICNDSSYVYATSFHQSSPNIELNDQSIVRLFLQGHSTGEVNIKDNGFLNTTAVFESHLQIKGNINNVQYDKFEGATISRQGI